MLKLRKLLTVSLTMALLSVGLGVAPAQAGAASTFISKINAERSARGLNKLAVYWDLTDDARAHSKQMLNKDKLFHNPNLAYVTSGWQALAENVGVGSKINSLVDAFMASAGHRKNILGNYNYIGVGVATEESGKMWVTMVFMRGPKDLLDPPPGDPPKDPPPADPPKSTPAKSDPPHSSRPPKAPAATGPKQAAVPAALMAFAPLPFQPTPD